MESRVVQLYAGAFVRDRSDRKDVESGVKTGDVALSFLKRGKQFPAQTEVQCQMAIHLPLVLAVETPVPSVGVDLRGSNCKERLRQPEEKIAERIVCERAVKVELAVVVGRLEVQWGAVRQPACVHSEVQRMLANAERDVVGELLGSRSGRSDAALADRVDSAISEGEGRKGLSRWMERKVYTIV